MSVAADDCIPDNQSTASEATSAVTTNGQPLVCPGNDFSGYLPIATVRNYLFSELKKSGKAKRDTIYEVSKRIDNTTRVAMQYYLVLNRDHLTVDRDFQHKL